MPAAIAVSSVVGSRPISCSSFLAALRSFISTSIMWTGMRIVRAWSAIARVIAWRIHHVAYVRELEAAAILVLVDRSHQARVAFLDQVQEAEAAIAVLLGDRNDEPQVAARKFALGVFELLELTTKQAAAAAKAGRAFERAEHHFAELVADRCDLVGRSARCAKVGQLPLEIVHPLRSIFELANQRLHAAGAQAQFLDEHEHLFAACGCSECGRRPCLRQVALLLVSMREILLLALHQVLQAAASCAACGPALAPW